MASKFQRRALAALERAHFETVLGGLEAEGGFDGCDPSDHQSDQTLDVWLAEKWDNHVRLTDLPTNGWVM